MPVTAQELAIKVYRAVRGVYCTVIAINLIDPTDDQDLSMLDFHVQLTYTDKVVNKYWQARIYVHNKPDILAAISVVKDNYGQLIWEYLSARDD